MVVVISLLSSNEIRLCCCGKKGDDGRHVLAGWEEDGGRHGRVGASVML